MPNEQVVIEFVPDYSKLQSAGEELQKSGLSAQQVDQFNQLNKATSVTAGNFSQISSAAKDATGSIDKLASATNNAAKGIVGAAGKQAFDQLRSSAQGATTEISKFSTSLDAAKAKLATLQEGTAAFDALSDEIKATEIAMATLGKTSSKLADGTSTIREETQAYTNALVRLKQAQLDNTSVYEAVKNSLSNLSSSVKKVGEEINNTSNDTKNLQGLVEGAEGVAGAFEAASGASLIFGEKSEDLEKSTQRVFAAMALANGIQKVYNTTLKESAAVQLIARGQTALQAVATQLAAAAESEYTVIRIAATVAQAALNAVIYANPVLLLVGALVVAGAALVAFTDNSDKAAEKQKKLNEEEKLQIDYLEQYQKGATQGIRDRITELQSELTVLKAKNVSQDVILAKEKQIAEEERLLAGNNHGYYAQEVKDISLVGAELESLKGKLQSLQTEKDNKQSHNFITRWLYGERKSDDIDKDIDNTKSKIENLQRQQDLGQKAQEDNQQKIAEDEAKAEEIRKHNAEEGLKDQIGYAQARLSLTKKSTEDELNAEIGLIQRKQALELYDANLTAGERKAIEEQNAREIRDLRHAYNLQVAQEDLSIFQTYVAGRLQVVNKGSDEELELEKRLLIQKRDVDLLAAKDNVREQQKVRLQFENDYSALLRNFTKQRQLDEIESEKFINQARLDATQQGTHEEYILKLQAIAIDEKEEIAAIDERVRYTDKGYAQIAEINARALQQQEDLRKQYLQKEIEDEAASAKEVNDIRISKLQNQANNPNVTQNKQFQLQQQIHEIELQNIQNEINENARKYREKLITQEDYKDRALQLANELTQKQGDIDNADLAHRKKIYTEIENTSIDIAQKIADATFEINDNNIKQEEENQMAALDRDREATLNQKFLTNQQRAVIDEAFKREQIAAEREADIKKRDNDTHQAEVDGFIAIAKVWAEHADDPILAAVLSALALANTEEQVSKIKSTPLPSYASGVESLEGPGGPTSDSILARLSRGERVVPAETNRRYYPALSAIHNHMVPPEIANNLLTAPITTTLPLDQLDGHRWNQGEQIDYDRLGEAVARHMGPHLSNLPINTFSFDERGFVRSVQKGIDKMTYVNKRYSSRK